MEKLLAQFPLPLIQNISCIESIVENCYHMTGYKFSVIFNGSKGYLSNIQIQCEGTQEEENRIFVERLRKANGSLKNVQVNIFHSEENGIRVSTGEDKPRNTCIVKTSGTMLRKRVVNDESEDFFYIQNAGFCGNAMFWWGKDMSGYVTNIRQAGKYTEEQAKIICMRKEDTAWPCSYIDNLTEAQKLIIDCQYPDPAQIKTWN